MSSPQMVRTDYAVAVNQIATDRNLPVEAIHDAISQAMVSAFRREKGELDENMYYFAQVDQDTGETRIFQAPVTARDEETSEITAWDEAKATDVTPAGFGRIAAQTAKQVILQKIRESERQQIISEYSEKIGELVNGQVLRMDGRTVVMDIGRGQGYMPPEEQMRGEFYRMNARIAVLIVDIRDTFKGQRIIVSRAHKDVVAKLFEREVPEVASGAVEIVSLAREAGVRTKLAVRSTQDGVDPVGSCVGQRGVRVQEVIRELNNEKVDIIPFTEDPVLFLRAALAPAESLAITLDESAHLATVTAPDDQLSLAIGRGGQNVRLAAKLTGWQITIKSASGKVESKVTGAEEYEIDTFDLAEETRQFLIQRKLTTLTDLARFKDKWMEAEELTQPQVDILTQKVTAFEEQERANQAAFAAAAAVKPSEEATAAPSDEATA